MNLFLKQVDQWLLLEFVIFSSDFKNNQLWPQTLIITRLFIFQGSESMEPRSSSDGDVSTSRTMSDSCIM